MRENSNKIKNYLRFLKEQTKTNEKNKQRLQEFFETSFLKNTKQNKIKQKKKKRDTTLYLTNIMVRCLRAAEQGKVYKNKRKQRNKQTLRDTRKQVNCTVFCTM